MRDGVPEVQGSIKNANDFFDKCEEILDKYKFAANHNLRMRDECSMLLSQHLN